MTNIHKDRAELKRLVESYGKDDVIKYVNHINESFVGTALAVVGGLIGFKIIKGLLLGLLGGTMAVKAKQKIQELEQYQAEMAEILEKYPDAQEQIKRSLRNRLNYVKLPEDSYNIIEKTGLGLRQYGLEGLSEEDKDRFMELFFQVKQIQDEAFKYYKEETLEKLGGKTSFVSKFKREMFGD